MFLKKNNQSYSPLLIFSLETPQESKSLTSVTIYLESPAESNTFQPIQNPVNRRDTAGEEVTDEEYWNHPLEDINATSSDDSDAESGNLFSQSKLLSEKSDKRYSGSSKYEQDHSWLYFSQTHRGWTCKICEKYPYSGGLSKGAFSTRAWENITHPSHTFRQHEMLERHILLEKKTIGSGSVEMTDVLAISKAQNINRQYINKFIFK